MRSFSFALLATAALGLASSAAAAPAPHGPAAAPAPMAHFHAGPGGIGPAPAFHAAPRPALAARFARPHVGRIHDRRFVGVVPLPVPEPVVVWNDWDWDWAPPAVWETDFAYAATCHIIRERIRTQKKRVIVREREVCD
jgi:hypothetical protein